ncbi:MAG TPA: hypothetical protein V6D26_01430 [Stenomitos sp.]
MKVNPKLAQRLFLCLTPFVTGSVFATLPGFAATLASSEASMNFSNFSHNPLTVETGKSPNILKSTNDGQVVVESKADAVFNLDTSSPSQTKAFSTSVSTVHGDGSGYSETAQSSARLDGYNFQVGAGETFSFDFSGFLSLKTSVDDESEAANTFGTIAFQLYDNTDSTQPPILLDFVTISSALNSLDNSDFLDVFQSSSVIINPDGTTLKNFGGNKEAASTDITGRVSRFFNRTTSLILKEFKSNSAGASCPSR